MKAQEAGKSTFEELRRIVARLRGPEGCPWDRVQTHRSLMPYLLEEAFEVLEALEEDAPGRLCEELGDLLLGVLLQTQIAEEAGEFALEDVTGGVAAKLVRRHPHVFGDGRLETPEQVIEQWDELKKREREGQSALAGIAATLPALAYTQAQQRRATRAGFRWRSVEGAQAKLSEELEELARAQTQEERAQEVGDVLFAMGELARWLEVDAELALRQANRRFGCRFRALESRLDEEGREMAEVEEEELLALWQRHEA